YEAFGQTVAATGSSTSPYRFAGSWGYRSDGEAALMQVGAHGILSFHGITCGQPNEGMGPADIRCIEPKAYRSYLNATD
ncbi:MAG: hypothetical protein ACP5VE_14055, partial [Chthonomonadales bacterium]